MTSSSPGGAGGGSGHGWSGGTTETTIAILAGGRSSRMGRDKADLDLGGHTFLERAARIALATGSPVLIVGRPPPADWRVQGVRFVEDELPNLGPLGGLVTALRAADSPVLLMACDMPLLDAASVEWLQGDWARVGGETGEPEALVPITDDGRLQPLFAVYHPSVLGRAEENLASPDRSLRGLLARLSSESTRPPPSVASRIRSVDTPGDYRALFTAGFRGGPGPA